MDKASTYWYPKLCSARILSCAYAMTEDADACLAAGCDIHLPKPIKKDNLMLILKSYAPGGPKAKLRAKTA